MEVECCLSQNQMCCLSVPVYEVHFKTVVKFALHYPDPPSYFVVVMCLYFVQMLKCRTSMLNTF